MTKYFPIYLCIVKLDHTSFYHGIRLYAVVNFDLLLTILSLGHTEPDIMFVTWLGEILIDLVLQFFNFAELADYMLVLASAYNDS